MAQRSFFGKAIAGGAVLGNTIGFSGSRNAWAARADIGEVVVERDVPGKPHKGKVLAAIQAHLDDMPHRYAGTCAKLINEGYTGYLIRTSNDEKCGPGTCAENIKSNEQENLKMAKTLGFTDVFDFYCRNHRMDGISSVEIRSRLIFLFRLLKVDTVVSMNPWGHGEENPDHWVTAKAVEEACWMSGMGDDYEEHLEAGVKPHSVRERYYAVMRPGQPFNRVVDISSTIEQKILSCAECKSQGGGNSGSKLRNRLAKEGKRLPILGNDDETADREYVRHFLIKGWSTFEDMKEKYGLDYAERFYYIDQRPPEESEVERYIKGNAVPLR
ncbi:MAG: hypothetical protein HOC71_02795 [Candidatus Latescibacteria bacterium]|nr:hypothetical protein [Candidatus Latescibacterota bacterium]